MTIAGTNTMEDTKRVSILVKDETNIESYANPLAEAGICVWSQQSDEVGDIAGIVLATGDIADQFGALRILRWALDSDLPILSLGEGMHLLNKAISEESFETTHDEALDKQRVFITPGSKLGHIVGGSGWLEMPTASSSSLPLADLSASLMASCYGGDSSVHAFEKVGHYWVIGLRWDVFTEKSLPRGFDKIAKAFIKEVLVRN